MERCFALYKLNDDKGRYMLGSGNNLAEYIPIEKVITMIKSVDLMS